MQRVLAGAVGTALAIAAIGLAGAAALLPGESPSSEVTISIRYSAFAPRIVTVPAGVPVRFSLVNDDPIDHEWIVGDPALHDRHRSGTEPVHDERPTEVSIPALGRRETTVVFEQPGTYPMICHLPSHEAYGMAGIVEVVDR